MYSLLDTCKKMHEVAHVALVCLCLAYLSFNYTQPYTPVNIAPLYQDAIKAADPFEDLKDGIYDYVTF